MTSVSNSSTPPAALFSGPLPVKHPALQHTACKRGTIESCAAFYSKRATCQVSILAEARRRGGVQTARCGALSEHASARAGHGSERAAWTAVDGSFHGHSC